MKTSQCPTNLSARRRAAAFLRGTDGAAMVVALSFILVFIAGLGVQMANYAWREAQWEELNQIRRAAVAAAGTMLDFDPADQAAAATAAQAVVETLAALLPGLSSNRVQINPMNNQGISTVTFVAGTFELRDLFGDGTSVVDLACDPNVPGDCLRVQVQLDKTRYEFALALDITGSMSLSIGGYRSASKIDALKASMDSVTELMAQANRQNPGAVMVSLVPFASMVNVADTAANAPLVDPQVQNNRTAAKERYVRMLAGALHQGQEMDIATTLAQAKLAAVSGEGQWVDTFQRYGVGNGVTGMSQTRYTSPADSVRYNPLRSLGLPRDLLDDQDWNLREEDIDIILGNLRPSNPAWTVDDLDFWNGCLMARWGAYWAFEGRPGSWDPDSSQFPVTRDVEGWSPRGSKLVQAPLHLSDAPPDASDPHTLFTAYSWPDAAISAINSPRGRGCGGMYCSDYNAGPGSADHWLHVVMARMLDGDPNDHDGDGNPDLTVPLLEGHGRRRYNDWTARASPILGVHGGNAMCPAAALMPLTDNVAEVRRRIADLQIVEAGVGNFLLTSGTPPVANQYGVRGSVQGAGHGATYIPRGMAWALRTLSPLWAPVWKVNDARSIARPGTTCATGEVATQSPPECDINLRKTIILVSDGSNHAGAYGFRQSIDASPTGPKLSSGDLNPHLGDDTHTGNRVHQVCTVGTAGHLTNYHKAWAAKDRVAFNQVFRDAGVHLDSFAGNRFEAPAGGRALEAFKVFETPTLEASLTRDGSRAAVLKRYSPWQFFRRHNNSVGIATDELMEPVNEFADLQQGVRRTFGRPTQLGSICQPQIPFGPYGGFDEHMLVGEQKTTRSLPGPLLPPVADKAPFAWVGDPAPGLDLIALHIDATKQLDDWTDEVCELVGQRGVGLRVVFIGNPLLMPHSLRRCVTKAGGDPAQDVFVTSNEANLKQAFKALMVVRRTLKFI